MRDPLVDDWSSQLNPNSEQGVPFVLFVFDPLTPSLNSNVKLLVVAFEKVRACVFEL